MMTGRLWLAVVLALVTTGCGNKLYDGYRPAIVDVRHHHAPPWCSNQGSNAAAVGACPQADMVTRTPLELAELNDRASAVIDAVATWNAAERASAGMVRMAERGGARVTLESAWLTSSTRASSSTGGARTNDRARARRR